MIDERVKAAKGEGGWGKTKEGAQLQSCWN